MTRPQLPPPRRRPSLHRPAHARASSLLFFGTIIGVNIVMVDLRDRHLPRPGRQEQLCRQPELQPAPSPRPGRRTRPAGGWSSTPTDGVLALRLADRDGVPLRGLDVTAAAGRPSTDRRGPDDRPASRTAPATAPPRRCRRDCGTSTIEAREDGDARLRRATAAPCRSGGGRLMDARDCHAPSGGCCTPAAFVLDRRAASIRASSAARTTAPATSTSSCRRCIAPPASAGSRTASTPCPASARPAPTSPATASASTSTPPPAIPTRCSPRSRALGYTARPFDAAAFDAASRDAVGGELLRCLAVAGFAAGNVMLLSVSVWSGAERRDARPVPLALGADRAAGDRLCRPPLLPLGAPQLAAGALNMDVPISIGVLLAAAHEPLRDGDRRRSMPISMRRSRSSSSCWSAASSITACATSRAPPRPS